MQRRLQRFYVVFAEYCVKTVDKALYILQVSTTGPVFEGKATGLPRYAEVR